MKSKRALHAIIILLTCCVLCVALCQVALYGCLLWDCAPQRSFRVLELDLPDDLFPRRAIINSLYPLSEGEGTTENGSKPVYWNEGGGGRAIYTVLRYPSTRQATGVFSLDKRVFADDGTKQPWERPSTLTFVSPQAEEFFLGCGYRIWYRCGMLARYAEYVVSFDSTIDSQMPYEEFEEIVKFIDNQISEKLYP